MTLFERERSRAMALDELGVDSLWGRAGGQAKDGVPALSARPLDHLRQPGGGGRRCGLGVGKDQDLGTRAG